MKRVIVFLTVLVLFSACAPRYKVVTQPPTGASIEDRVKREAERIRLEKEIREKQEALKKLDTPEMREARRKIEKEEKTTEKRVKQEIESRASLDIKGCDPNTLYVNPSLGTTYGLRNTLNHSMVRLTIFNKGQQPISVRSTLHNTLIENLCPGGSLTLTFAVNVFSPTNAPTQFELTAYSSSTGAGTLTETKQVSIYKEYDWNSRRIEGQTWEVRLSR